MNLMAELIGGVKCKVVDWYVTSDILSVEMEHPDVTSSIVKCHLDDCQRLYWNKGETIYENKTTSRIDG